MFDWLGLSASTTLILGWVLIGLAVVVLVVTLVYAYRTKEETDKLEKPESQNEEGNTEPLQPEEMIEGDKIEIAKKNIEKTKMSMEKQERIKKDLVVSKKKSQISSGTKKLATSTQKKSKTNETKKK